MKKLKPDCQNGVLSEKFFIFLPGHSRKSFTTLIDKNYWLAYNDNQSRMRYGHNTRLYCYFFPMIKRSYVFKRYDPMIVIGGLNFWRLKSCFFPVSALRKNNLKRQLEQMIAIKSTTPIMLNQKSATLLFTWSCQTKSIQGINWHSTKIFQSRDIQGRSTFIYK